MSNVIAPYYGLYWELWVKRKINGEGVMPEKINYVCPECGCNDEISENVPIWVEYVGKFTEYGDHKMDTDEEAILGNSLDNYDPYYHCYSCGERFNNPITIEEFKTKQKEESND